MSLFADAAVVPVVCVVLEGGPNTLETVRSAIVKGTPAIVVEVYKVIVLQCECCCHYKDAATVCSLHFVLAFFCVFSVYQYLHFKFH